MSSAEAAQAMSKELQLSLGPDAGPNEECHDRDIELMGAEDGPKAQGEAGGHRLLGDTSRAPHCGV